MVKTQSRHRRLSWLADEHKNADRCLQSLPRSVETKLLNGVSAARLPPWFSRRRRRIQPPDGMRAQWRFSKCTRISDLGISSSGLPQPRPAQ